MAIKKGYSLKSLLAEPAINLLAANIATIYPDFPRKRFLRDATKGLAPLMILARGHHVAHALRTHLPEKYAEAIQILLASISSPSEKTEQAGLGGFFYLPHVFFVANYGLDPKFNAGKDPFAISMQAQYELTQRFTAEFSIRPFLIKEQSRTLKLLKKWAQDPNPHVRRLCSEGSRPRLPWAIRIPAFVKDPSPALPILEKLKDDPALYVRRSVANHIGDIAKDHLGLALEICESWLPGASSERKWVIRHALRYPAKKGSKAALKLRLAAK